MDGYICKVCKSKQKDGSVFCSVLCSDSIYVPTCSTECFKVEKDRQLKIAMNRLEKIEKQFPIIQIW